MNGDHGMILLLEFPLLVLRKAKTLLWLEFLKAKNVRSISESPELIVLANISLVSHKSMVIKTYYSCNIQIEVLMLCKLFEKISMW